MTNRQPIPPRVILGITIAGWITLAVVWGLFGAYVVYESFFAIHDPPPHRAAR